MVMSEVKEITEAVQTILQPLADKLGTTAQHVWELQVKQAYVDGYISTFWFLVGLFVIIRSYIVVKKITKGKVEIKKEDEDYHKIVTYAIFIIIGIVVVLSNFSTILNCLINPEYYALQHLIQLVKQ